MAEDPSKMTRRVFLKHSAMTTAAAGAFYSIALKTDAQEQEDPMPRHVSDDDLAMPYTYHDPLPEP